MVSASRARPLIPRFDGPPRPATWISNSGIEVGVPSDEEKLSRLLRRRRRVDRGKILRFAFAAGVGECKEKGGFRSPEVAEEKAEGETAFVRGEVRYGNGSEDSIDMKMYKGGGAWKIVRQPPQEGEGRQ